MAKAPVKDSRGRHALLALLDGDGTQKGFAESLKGDPPVTQAQISQIVTRDRLPGRKLANRFVEKGIETTWWDEAPTKAQLTVDRSRQAKGAA